MKNDNINEFSDENNENTFHNEHDDTNLNDGDDENSKVIIKSVDEQLNELIEKAQIQFLDQLKEDPYKQKYYQESQLYHILSEYLDCGILMGFDHSNRKVAITFSKDEKSALSLVELHRQQYGNVINKIIGEFYEDDEDF